LDVSGAKMEKIHSVQFIREPRVIFPYKQYLLALHSWGDHGLQVINISTPDQPVVQGFYLPAFGGTEDFSFTETTGYVVGGDTLYVLDLSNMQAPQVVKKIVLKGLLCAEVTNKTLYIGAWNNLYVFDVTDPNNPVHKKTLDMPRVNDLVFKEKYLYLAWDSTPDIGIKIMDITNPLDPQEVTFKETVVTTTDNGNTLNEYKSPEKIAVDNDKLVAACRGSIETFVFDISNPADPVEKGRAVFDPTVGWPSISSLYAQNGFAYVCTGGTSYPLLKIDISDAENPVIADQYEDFKAVTHVTGEDNRLYVASDERLWIYDNSDVESPKLIGSDFKWYNLHRIAVKDQMLYALRNDSCYILNVTDPQNVVQVGVYVSENGNELRDIRLKDGQAHFISIIRRDEPGFYEIAQVTDPANPANITNKQLSGEPLAIALPENQEKTYIAYSLDEGSNDVIILDTTDPANPDSIGKFSSAGDAMTLWVNDTLALVGSIGDEDTWMLESFDVTNPSTPARKAERHGSGFIEQVAMQDNIVFATIQGDLSELAKADAPVYFKLDRSEDGQIHLAWDEDRLKKTSADTMGGFLFAFGLSGLSQLFSLSVWSASLFYLLVAALLGFYLFYIIMGWLCPDLFGCSGSYGLVVLILIYLIVGVGGQKTAEHPEYMQLLQNYPNPFNPETTIEYNVTRASHVELNVYNLRGELLKKLVDEMKQPGSYKVKFESLNLASGIYTYQMRIGDRIEQKKMMVIR
ncbi:T9SS type A sorting domain-containing protein, partial [bacterium]|nr:T9SS type A sorting domain-containing protein [candidate division CSSED10-310 bacterium]